MPGLMSPVVYWVVARRVSRVVSAMDSLMAAMPGGALTRAHEIGEPAGQIAARQLEIDRIRSALLRAEELSTDVATAIESAAT